MRNFRHLKDISSFTQTLMKSHGLTLFSIAEELVLRQNEVGAHAYLRQAELLVFWAVPWTLSLLGQLLGELQALERY